MNELPPGLAGYVSAQQGNDQRSMKEAQMAQAVMGILSQRAQMDEMQRKVGEQQRIRGVLSSLPGGVLDLGTVQRMGAEGVDIRPLLDLYKAQTDQKRPIVAAPGSSVLSPDGGSVLHSVPERPKEPAQTDLAKLLAERKALPQNDPNIPFYDAKIKKLTEQTPPVQLNMPNPDKTFEREDKLRNDYKGDVKAFREVQDAHRIISGALQNPSPANDMAAATKFMKLLDPGSVVRESELAMAMQASGLMDRVANYHNMLLRGEKLTPQQRIDFAKAANLIFDSVQTKWSEIDSLYDSAAKDYGLDPKRIKMGGGAPSKNDKPKPTKDPAVEDWISRAMKRNMVSRDQAIAEGRKLGKVPETY